MNNLNPKKNLARGLVPEESSGGDSGPSLNTAVPLIDPTVTTIESVRDGVFEPWKFNLSDGLAFLRYQVIVWGSRKEQNPIREGKHVIDWIDGATTCRVRHLLGFGTAREKAYHMAVKNAAKGVK